MSFPIYKKLTYKLTTWTRHTFTLLLLFSFCNGVVASGKGDNETPLAIYVSILPQKYLIERIGQQHVRVSTMVGPGQSPATYEPTPKQMSQLSTCDAYFRIGVPFEKMWINKIAAANSQLLIFDMHVKTAETEPHEHNDGTDPHIWTNPLEVKQLAQQVASRLAQIDPVYEEFYSKNYLLVEKDLDDLDLFIKQHLATGKINQFMVYHPAWGHFAEQYGLTQIAIEKNGKEPGAKALAQLIETAKQNRIKHIFVQRQFNRRSADIIARAINAEVIVVDPLAENVIDTIKDFTLKLTQGS